MPVAPSESLHKVLVRRVQPRTQTTFDISKSFFLTTFCCFKNLGFVAILNMNSQKQQLTQKWKLEKRGSKIEEKKLYEPKLPSINRMFILYKAI